MHRVGTRILVARFEAVHVSCVNYQVVTIALICEIVQIDDERFFIFGAELRKL